MKSNLFISLAAAIALLLLYLSFALTFAQSGVATGATGLELGIFVLQFGKMVVIASVGRLRNTRFVNVIDVLGIEIVIMLPALAIATVFFGVHSAPSLVNQTFLAWVAGVASFGSPYAIYRLTRAMYLGETLIVVLPSAILLSEILIVIIAGASIASGTGLQGFSRGILLVGAGISTTAAHIDELTLLLPLSILYVSLLLYSVAPLDAVQLGRLRGPAGLAVLATALTYAGAYAASEFALALTYLVLPATILTVSLIWWATREV
jgi:hypothetical protein